MSQPDLFSPPLPTEDDIVRGGLAAARAALENPARAKSIRERDDAIAQVDANAPDLWKHEAWSFICAYLERHPELFCDDLWDAGMPEPPNRRALGPLMQRAARERLMEKTGRYRPSVSSHQIPKDVWRSLIYGGER